MDLTLTTPGLLFPAISLLLLAYTNRFLALASVIRQLHADEQRSPDPLNRAQLTSLRQRVRMIRQMQEFGVAAFLCCVLSMAALFFQVRFLGEGLFGLSLVLFAVSLVLSILEIRISVRALDIRLSDMESGHSPSI